MILINGQILCNQIDKDTKSFLIYHNHGTVRAISKTFTIELNGIISSFMPLSVIFTDESIEVVLDISQIIEDGKINYSFSLVWVQYGPQQIMISDIYSKLYILYNKILYAKANIFNIPTTPTNLRINNEIHYSGPSVDKVMTWNESTDSNGGAISYVIEIYNDNEEMMREIVAYGPWEVWFYSVAGSYYYRVKAISQLFPDPNKPWEYIKEIESEWSNNCYFEITTESFKLFAKTCISEKLIGRFFSKLFIKGRGILNISTYIIPKIIGKVMVCNRNTSGFFGLLKIPAKINIYAKMNIKTNFRDIYSKLYITGRRGYLKELFSKMLIAQKEYPKDLYSKTTVCDIKNSNMHGKVFVIAKRMSNFYGRLNLVEFLLFGKTNVIVSSIKELYGKLTLNNYPAIPIVTSDVGNDWQENNLVTISWTVDESNTQTNSYRYYMSKVKYSSFSEISFTNTNNNEISFDLNDMTKEGMDGAGEYYFYVNSVGRNGSVSETVEYIIRYNDKPTIPGKIMMVNGNNSTEETPIISRKENNIFSWTSSTDENFNTNIKYELQISSDMYFSNILLIKENIGNEPEEGIVSTTIKHNYDGNNIFYWRVRSFDSFQYSDFSRIASFKGNIIPGAPSNLTVQGV